MPRTQPPHSPPAAAPAPPQLLDATELGALLHMSRIAVYQAHERGEIPQACIVRIGRRLRFKAAAIAAWIDSMTIGKVAA